MEAGNLRHRVTIQTAGATQNGAGEPVVTWSDSATVWASIEPIRGTERQAAQQMTATMTHTVRMRYRASMSVANRLKFGSRYLEINAVIDPGERHERLELLCTEVAL